MKNIIIILASIFFLGMTISTNAQSKNMDGFTIQVDGLGCPFCAYGLEKKFKELKGIKKISIEMETGNMKFQYPADKQLSIEQVKTQVEKAGYTPVSVIITRANGHVETSANQNTSTNTNELKTTSLVVAGNCEMCKARIENAVRKLEGVQFAEWNKETKELQVKHSTHVSLANIEKTIAKVGHDTKTVKANKSTYNNLPGCCQYKRIH